MNDDVRMAIIDGTGEADDSLYATAMEHSFCKQLETYLGKHRAKYVRGPSMQGKETTDRASDAFEWLKKQSGRLMLAGYSRGGSAAIMVAEKMEQEGREIDSLFLFDAVARHDQPGGQVIPANVRYSRHARRDQSVMLVLKYEATFSDVKDTKYDVLGVPGMLPASNPMRPTFGNTGLRWYGKGYHQLATAFRGSHGALGGVGWPFVTEDEGCQAEVAEWMNRRLYERGVGTPLVAHPPVGPKTAPAGWPRYLTAVPGAVLDLLLLGSHNLLTLGGAGRLPGKEEAQERYENYRPPYARER